MYVGKRVAALMRMNATREDTKTFVFGFQPPVTVKKKTPCMYQPI